MNREEKIKYLSQITIPFEAQKEGKSVIQIDQFGCLNEKVVKLVKSFLKLVNKDDSVEVVFPDDKDNDNYFPVGSVVVPIDSHADHNYNIDEPCMIILDDHAIKIDGSKGNCLPDQDQTDYIRRATMEEIEEFVDKCTDFHGVIVF